MRSHDELVKIIDDLKDFGDYCLRWGNDLRGNLLKIAAETIAELEHEHAETSLEMQRQMCRADGGRWIPATVPPDDTIVGSWVLCAVWDKKGRFYWPDLRWYFNGKFIHLGKKVKGKVAYWMPVPEMPKGGPYD